MVARYEATKKITPASSPVKPAVNVTVGGRRIVTQK